MQASSIHSSSNSALRYLEMHACALCLVSMGVALLVAGMGTLCSTLSPECSRFHYEEQLLEKMVRMEIGQEARDKQLNQCLEDNSQQQLRLKELGEQVQDLQTRLSTARTYSGTSGTTYVRWGRMTCPEASSLVYEGFVAGSHYSHHGSGANYLCLPAQPVWGKHENAVEDLANIYATEYKTSNSPVFKHLNDQEAPCAVCHVATSNVLMIPGRNACYPGWTLQYAGYLMAEHYSYPSNKGFICVDGDAEPTNCSSMASESPASLFHVENRCNPLKCPPYMDGRELTCAVCSKTE